MRPESRSRTNCFRSSGSGRSSTSTSMVTRVSTLLTFCPPGPLLRRIDIINHLKQSQRGPVPAMHILMGLDPSPIDSIAIDDTSITINSHGEISTDAEIVDKRAANGRFVLKVKI